MPAKKTGKRRKLGVLAGKFAVPPQAILEPARFLTADQGLARYSELVEVVA